MTYRSFGIGEVAMLEDSSPQPSKQPNETVSAGADVTVDEAQASRFFSRLFEKAKPGEGFYCARAFSNLQGSPPSTDWIKFGDPDALKRLISMARDAARRPVGDAGWCLAPPPVLFASSSGEALKAGAAQVVFASALVVDLDADPANGLAKLETVLGPASIVVESGGVWQGVPKVHAYWILHEPARDKLRQGGLKLARKYASSLVGGDPTANSLAHPMRLPGSLHTKSVVKRLVRIVADRPLLAIDLANALAKLHDALAAAGIKIDGDLLEPAQPRTSFRTTEALSERDLMLMASQIPNTGLHWNDYRSTMLAFFDASHGNIDGLEAAHLWAAKDERYEPDEVDTSWAHIRMSPPSLVSERTLRNKLRTANPTALREMEMRRWFEPPADAPNALLEPREAIAVDLATEMRVADGFAATYADVLRYVHDEVTWLIWTGTRFSRDVKGRVGYLTARYVRSAVGDAKANVKTRVEKSGFISGVQAIAKSDERIATSTVEWDRDPYIAGTPDGVLDLRTGIVRPARPEDAVTRQLGTSPSIDAWCPLWREFLSSATGGDRDLMLFLQRFFGYCLTGDVKEHMLLFLFGDGGNGKGTAMSIVTKILGDYAVTADMAVFTESKYQGHSTSVAMLAGGRLVTASETQSGNAWNEQRVKAVTGGDPITARRVRENNFTFMPQFKLVISGNHKPVLRNVDNAARRRFAMVPFNHMPKRVDPDLVAKLWDEAPGILRWLIDGCLDWQKNGLPRPPVVLKETEAYFEVQDIFGQWLEEYIEPCGSEDVVPTARLFRSWAQFAKDANEDPGTAKSFSGKFTAKGFAAARTAHARGFKGVRFRADSVDGSVDDS